MPEFHSELSTISERPYWAEAYIPASTVQVHASNLLLLPSGDLLCAWFGGSQEGCSDISVHISRLPKGAKTWSAPRRISDDPDRSEQNPVLFLNPQTLQLWVLYTAQPAGNQDKAVVRYRISSDKGETWSEAHQLLPEEGLFIRQPIVVLKDGTWVLPAWYCRTPPGFRWNGNDDVSVIRYSKDGGRTWGEKGVPNSIGCVHMNIKELLDGSYIAFFRSRWAANVYRSTSTNGLDWIEPTPTSLPNPNSGICFDVLPSGKLMLIYNDSSASSNMPKREGLYDDITPESDKRVNQPSTTTKEAFWGAPRKDLTVGISSDSGKTWKTKVVEHGDGFCMTNNSKERMNRELSYPSIAVEKDGMVHLAFTFWRQRIKYVRLNGEFVNL